MYLLIANRATEIHRLQPMPLFVVGSKRDKLGPISEMSVDTNYLGTTEGDVVGLTSNEGILFNYIICDLVVIIEDSNTIQAVIGQGSKHKVQRN